jgi:C4-dicarboxylate transporter DctQ subunit
MLLRPLQSLSRALGWIEDTLCAVALGSVALIICAQVVTRYVFNYTPSWSEELSRYLVVWTIFVGTAVGVRKNIHIGVDAFIRLAPPWMKKGFDVLLNLVGAVVSAYLIYLSALFIKDTIDYAQLSPAMQIPMYLPYLAMPVGLSFSVVHFLHDIVKVFTAGEAPQGLEDVHAATVCEPAAEPTP